jgi:serine/threonine protein kinase
MGEVYRAHDPRIGRDVAIKVLPVALSQDRDHLQRFEQEARATGTLNHPNLLVIFDFGLAKLVQPDDSALSATAATQRMATTLGVVLGTVGYMSPEQVRGTTIDHRSDVFSFAVVLYEMISGVQPFRHDSAVETMNAILTTIRR